MKKTRIDPEKIIEGKPVDLNGRSCNIPPHRNMPPPPPNKKSIWERYSSGEILIPTYDKVIPKTNIVLPNKVIKSEPIPVKDFDNPFGELAEFLLNGFKNIIKG